MRTLGFIQFAALGISCLTVARRLPPTKVPSKMFDFKIFKHRAYSVYCFANIIVFLGLYTVCHPSYYFSANLLIYMQRRS